MVTFKCSGESKKRAKACCSNSAIENKIKKLIIRNREEEKSRIRLEARLAEFQLNLNELKLTVAESISILREFKEKKLEEEARILELERKSREDANHKRWEENYKGLMDVLKDTSSSDSYY